MTLVFPAPGGAVAGPAGPATTVTEFQLQNVRPPTPETSPPPPILTAKAAVVVDLDTGRLLFAQAPDERRAIASITKIMTAVLALENLDLVEKVTISKTAAGSEGSLLGLVEGEQVMVENLLYALLVCSGNDAAIALAEAVAGDVDSFADKMNQKARDLGLKNTHFVNPHGLPAEGHFSSARDLATLATYAMRDPVFRQIVDTTQFEVLRPNKEHELEPAIIENSNKLLQDYGWINGVKTGWTIAAGYCVVASGERDGVSLLTVLLGAKDSDTRWVETKALLDYGLALYPKVSLATKGGRVWSVLLDDLLGREIELVAGSSLKVGLYPTDVVTPTVRLEREAILPISAGEAFGEIEFSAGRRHLGTVPLVASESLEEITILMMLGHWQDELLSGLAIEDRLAALS